MDYESYGQSGEGNWRKAVGGTLMGLAAAGTVGGLDTEPASAIIGGSILGAIGAALYHSGSKGKGMTGAGTVKKVDQEFVKRMKKLLKPHHVEKMKGGMIMLSGQGLRLAGQGKKQSITNQHIKQFMNHHKNTKIHISDLLGKDWRKKKNSFQKAVERVLEMRAQQGGNLWKKIKKGTKKGLAEVGKFSKKAGKKIGHELKRFIDGKTKFKPSTLMNILGGAVGVVGAASAFIPGVDLISVPAASAAALGLKSAGTILKSTGRGKKVVKDKVPDDVKQLMLQNRYLGHSMVNKHQGAGMLPMKHMNYIKKYPEKVKMILNALKKYQSGQGLLKKALVGVGGLALYGFLKENPHLISQVGNMLAKYMAGRGTSLAGGGTSLAGGALKLPAKLSKFVRDHPNISKKIAKLAHRGKGYQTGTGTLSKIIAAAGLVGTTAAGTGYILYNYLLDNPMIAAKIAAKATARALLGSGYNYTGAGKKYKRKKGLIIGTKKEVWDDNSPCQITSGGLKKCDLMRGKGNKIISKKRHMIGKKMYEQNKGHLIPFKAHHIKR